jgi:hypothetical protein
VWKSKKPKLWLRRDNKSVNQDISVAYHELNLLTGYGRSIWSPTDTYFLYRARVPNVNRHAVYYSKSSGIWTDSTIKVWVDFVFYGEDGVR